MKCKMCGSELQPGLKVCPICGFAVPKQETKEEKPADPKSILKEFEQEKTKLIDECAKSVTKVMVRHVDSISSGTGWHGYKNAIFTNAHVIGKEAYEKITVEFSDHLDLGDGQRMEMRLIYISETEDIAILTPVRGVIPDEVPVLEIDTNETKQGELVFTIGNPLHYKFTYTEGAIANPNYKCRFYEGRSPVLQTTLTLNHGNSGGPVFDINGHVVGMTTFSELHEDTEQVITPSQTGSEVTEQIKLKEILGYGFCVKAKTIKNALEGVVDKII